MQDLAFAWVGCLLGIFGLPNLKSKWDEEVYWGFIKWEGGRAWWKGLPAVDREKGSRRRGLSTLTNKKVQPALFHWSGSIYQLWPLTVDVDNTALFLVDVDHPALFHLVDATTAFFYWSMSTILLFSTWLTVDARRRLRRPFYSPFHHAREGLV